MLSLKQQKTARTSRPGRAGILIGAVCALTVLLVGADAATAGIELVGHWTLDETSGNFADTSGNGNLLQPINSPHGNGTNGIVGGAMDLQSSGPDYAQRPGTVDDSFGAFSITDTFSGAMWLYQETPNTEFRYFMGREDGGERKGWAFRVGTASDRDQLRLQFRDPVVNNLGSIETAGSGPLSQTGWIFLSFVHRGELDLDGSKLYVNGVEWTNTNTNTPSATPSDPVSAVFSIGARFSEGGGAVDGLIDEAQLYSGALADWQVEYLFNNPGAVAPVPEPATFMLWAGLLAAGGMLRCRRRRR